jgi:hypothetical protein
MLLVVRYEEILRSPRLEMSVAEAMVKLYNNKLASEVIMLDAISMF